MARMTSMEALEKRIEKAQEKVSRAKKQNRRIAEEIQMENIAEKLKGIIDNNGPEYLSEESYKV